jgi:hypothetical protein
MCFAEKQFIISFDDNVNDIRKNGFQSDSILIVYNAK